MATGLATHQRILRTDCRVRRHVETNPLVGSHDWGGGGGDGLQDSIGDGCVANGAEVRQQTDPAVYGTRSVGMGDEVARLGGEGGPAPVIGHATFGRRSCRCR